MRTPALIATLAAAAALAGCGGGDTPTGDPATGTATQSSGLAAGPAISIDEAVGVPSGQTLLVTGHLLADRDEVRLCSGFAESMPPQCVGPSLVVEGLNLEEVGGLEMFSGVSWGVVELLGVVADGTLTVSENARA